MQTTAADLNRYEIDPALVDAAIAKKLERNERERESLKKNALDARERYEAALADGTFNPLRDREPFGPGYVDPMIDEWNARENDYYRRVRIVEKQREWDETPQFYLVYGDDDDAGETGTGGFATREKAEAWFTGGGR